MFRKCKEQYRKLVSFIKKIILKYYKQFFKFLFTLIIIATSWYGFIFLVGKPPIETTPALIMVWMSALLLFVAIFPKIFDRIKRLKLKDFEIELRDSVVKSAIDEDFISIDDIDEYVFSQKGSFRNLSRILKKAKRNPDKQVLLTVNLFSGSFISIPMLFIYIFFLDMISQPVNILFITYQRSIRDYSDIPTKSILGVIDGKKVLKTFFEKFPWLFRIFEFRGIKELRMDKFFHRTFLDGSRQENFFFECYDFLRERISNESEFLTEDDVIFWFGRDLNSRIVDIDEIDINNRQLKDAIEKGDEFLIISKNKSFRSIIAICKVAKNISSKVISKII